MKCAHYVLLGHIFRNRVHNDAKLDFFMKIIINLYVTYLVYFFIIRTMLFLFNNRCPMLCRYEINGRILDKETEIRDLGVLLDDKLRFTKHVEAMQLPSIRYAREYTLFILRFK